MIEFSYITSPGSDYMFNYWLINKFIPDSKKGTRKSYGILGGIVGITVNITLFIVKLTIGLLLNSVAVLADAFNNLSDTGSSVVTLVGFNISNKPADKDHPFGHGRGEYIAGLIVSFMVVIVGIQFVKDSFSRILHPVKLKYDTASFIILLISIGAKAWLGKFYNSLNKFISSETLSATSFDSFSDVITTSTVALSILASKYISFPIDGYAGLIVSVFILYGGYRLIKDTISPLLGEAPNPELVKSIINEALSFKEIIGVHDLIIHTYGAGQYMATIHAELPSNISFMDAHEIIDDAEYKISKKLGIKLIIHTDPVDTDNIKIHEIKSRLQELIKSLPGIISAHDVRYVEHKSHKSILFDLVISDELSRSKENTYVETIKNSLKEGFPGCDIFIALDRNYIDIKN